MKYNGRVRLLLYAFERYLKARYSSWQLPIESWTGLETSLAGAAHNQPAANTTTWTFRPWQVFFFVIYRSFLDEESYLFGKTQTIRSAQSVANGSLKVILCDGKSF